MNEKVSVIIPCYNREKTIGRCIRSVLKQSKAVHEIIITDDGSTDKSIEIIEGLIKDSGKNIILLKQEHLGAQAARNKGIRHSTGEFIAFLDSDDEWCTNLLEEELKVLSSFNYEKVVYSDCFVCTETRNRIWKLPDGKNCVDFLKHTGPMIQMICKKDYLYEIGLLDEEVRAYQEWDTAISLSKNHDFIHIKKPLFKYFLHDGETISKDLSKTIDGYFYIVQKNRKSIIDKCGTGSLINHYKVLKEKAIENHDRRLLLFCIYIFVYTIEEKMYRCFLWILYLAKRVFS